MAALDSFQARFGSGVPYEAASDAVVNTYEGKLPKELITLWRESGFCSYAQGRIWIVNPEPYAEVMTEWLPDWCSSADEAPVVFARGAFGDLLVSHHGEVGHLNVHYGRYVQIGGKVDLFLKYILDDAYLEDALDGGIALQAIKKFGPIAQDEMFTFVPALSLGGFPELQFVQKVKMSPQLSILAQIYDKITVE